MDETRSSSPFGLISLARSAAMVAAAMTAPCHVDTGRLPDFPRKMKPADPTKKAARKRQKAARAKNRKGK